MKVSLDNLINSAKAKSNKLKAVIYGTENWVYEVEQVGTCIGHGCVGQMQLKPFLIKLLEDDSISINNELIIEKNGEEIARLPLSEFVN